MNRHKRRQAAEAWRQAAEAWRPAAEAWRQSGLSGGAKAVYDAMARVAASTGQEIDEATNARLVGYCKRMGMAKAASEMARHTKPLIRG